MRRFNYRQGGVEMTHGESIPQPNGEDEAFHLIDSVEIPPDLRFLSRAMQDARRGSQTIPEQRTTPRIAIAMEQLMQVIKHTENPLDYMDEVMRLSSSSVRAEEHRALQEIFRRMYLELMDMARDSHVDISPERRVILLAFSVELRSLMYQHIQLAWPKERKLILRDRPWPETPKPSDTDSH